MTVEPIAALRDTLLRRIDAHDASIGIIGQGGGRAVKGAKVLVLGLAYKKDIEDPRESPAFEVIHDLYSSRTTASSTTTSS